MNPFTAIGAWKTLHFIDPQIFIYNRFTSLNIHKVGEVGEINGLCVIETERWEGE